MWKCGDCVNADSQYLGVWKVWRLCQCRLTIPGYVESVETASMQTQYLSVLKVWRLRQCRLPIPECVESVETASMQTPNTWECGSVETASMQTPNTWECGSVETALMQTHNTWVCGKCGDCVNADSQYLGMLKVWRLRQCRLPIPECVESVETVSMQTHNTWKFRNDLQLLYGRIRSFLVSYKE